MPTLLRSVTIIDSSSNFNKETIDILIENGLISKIDVDISIPPNTKIIELEDIFVSPAWCDLQVDFCEPGFEYQEDIYSGTKAAAAGGFSAVGLIPNHKPVTDNQAQVQFIRNKNPHKAIEISILGALTKNLNGKDLSEIYDLMEVGVIGFSQATKAIQDDGLMLRALQYVSLQDGVIFNYPNNFLLSNGELMNEGEVSTMLGLKGVPHIAESLMVARDIELAKYTNSHVHFAQITTAQSVKLIEQAKNDGVKITASVSPYHLIFTDEMMESFDTNWKIFPPLRTQKDVESLKKGLKNGTIDAITTVHLPQHHDKKHVEFDVATFGIIGLETAYALLNTHLSDEFSQEELVVYLSKNPRSILKMPKIEIKEGTKANLTLFNPNKKWVVKAEELHSKSKNTPFIGETFTGKPLGIFNNGEIMIGF